MMINQINDPPIGKERNKKREKQINNEKQETPHFKEQMLGQNLIFQNI